jgi:hypothetical protein
MWMNTNYFMIVLLFSLTHSFNLNNLITKKNRFNVVFSLKSLHKMGGLNVKMSKTRLYNLDNEDWEAGEVGWDYIQNTQYNSQLNIKNNVELGIIQSQSLKKNNMLLMNPDKMYDTPLQKTLITDQTKIASFSAIIKTSYKEIFNLDTLIAEFNNNINSQITVFMPTEIIFLTFLYGIAILYNKTTDIELRRLNTLYKFNSQSQYFEKYIKIRKITMTIFIITTIILTKNIQIAE